MSDFKIPDKPHFSAREVSRILGISLSTVASRIREGFIASEEGRDVLGFPNNRRVVPYREVVRLAKQMRLIIETEEKETEND